MCNVSGPSPFDEPRFQYIPPYQGAAGRAFQKFTHWLKNERFHQRGQYCQDDACRICAAWRNIHRAETDRGEFDPCEYILEDMTGMCGEVAVARVAPWPAYTRHNYCQSHAAKVRAADPRIGHAASVVEAYGHRRGRQIAEDALAALATEALPCPGRFLPLIDEQRRFDRALRVGFFKTIRNNTPDSSRPV